MPQITRPVLIPAQLHLASGRLSMAQHRRPASSYVTGAILSIDGGYTVW
jgi:hypothetical protein